MPLAIHSLLDFHRCDSARLEEQAGLRQAMINAITEAGGTYVTDVFHAFHPHGLSGIIVIAESHVAIHTWPEHRFAAVDIFSCSPTLDQQLVAERLQQWLQAGEVTVDRRERGHLDQTPRDPASVAIKSLLPTLLTALCLFGADEPRCTGMRDGKSMLMEPGGLQG